MKKFFRWFFEDAINPTVWVRLYTVDFGGWFGGHSKSFWLHRNALRFAKQQHDLFVSIRNEITDTSERIRDNPDNVQHPPIQFPGVIKL